MPDMSALDGLKESLSGQLAPQGGSQTDLGSYMPAEQQAAAPAAPGMPQPPMPGPEMGMQDPNAGGMPDLGQITLSDLLTMGLSALMTGLTHMQPPSQGMPPMGTEQPPMGGPPPGGPMPPA